MPRRSAPPNTSRRSPEEAYSRYVRLLGGGGPLVSATSDARDSALVDGVRREVADVACGVFAPVLVGFAAWLAAEAGARKLDRLYFVSRDGQLPLDVAGPLFATFAPDVECRYLYGSRDTWHLASVGPDEGRGLDEWMVRHRDTAATTRSILAKVRVSPDRAYALTGAPQLSPDRADDLLSTRDRYGLVEYLKTEPIAEHLRVTAAEERRVAVEYLDQEGFGDPLRTGVVDVGWLGRTSRSLDDILRSANLVPPAAYLYVGLNQGADVFSGAQIAQKHAAWLFDLDEGRLMPGGQVPGVVLMLEAMCAGREGRTVRYQRGPDGVEPVLASTGNVPALRWGLDDVQRCVIDVARRVAEAGPSADFSQTDGVAAALLRCFWESPTPAEMTVWSSFPYDEDGSENGQPLATPVSWSFVRGQLRAGRLTLRPVASWLAGTMFLSPQPWRGLLRVRAGLGRWAARGARAFGRGRGTSV